MNKEHEAILTAIRRLTTRELNTIMELSGNSDFSDDKSLFVFTAREIASMAKIKLPNALAILEQLKSQSLVCKVKPLTSNKPEYCRCWQSKDVKKQVNRFKKHFS